MKPRRLEETLKEANRRFDPALAAPFTLSKGDTFQGLFKTPSRFPKALLWLEARLRTQGLSARYGVGLGAVEGLARRGRASTPARLTGEAFFRADAVLGEARKRRVLAAVRSADFRWDLAANAVFLLLDHIASRWPPEVWQRVENRRPQGGSPGGGDKLPSGAQAVRHPRGAGRAPGALGVGPGMGGSVKVLGLALLWLLAVPGGSPFVRWVLGRVPPSGRNPASSAGPATSSAP